MNFMAVWAGLGREVYLKIIGVLCIFKTASIWEQNGIQSLFCEQQFKVSGALHFEGDQDSERVHCRGI